VPVFQARKRRLADPTTPGDLGQGGSRRVARPSVNPVPRRRHADYGGPGSNPRSPASLNPKAPAYYDSASNLLATFWQQLRGDIGLALLSAKAATPGHPPRERPRRVIFDAVSIEPRDEGWVIAGPSAGWLFEIERCMWSSDGPLVFDAPAGALEAFLRAREREEGRKRRYREAMVRLGRPLRGPSRYEEESSLGN